MAQKKISELPLTKTMNNDDIFPIVQSGVTKQISYSDLKKPMVEEVTADVSSYIDSKTKDIINDYKDLTEYKTVNSEGVSNQLKIGTWIDGHPIYRSVYLKDDIKVKDVRIVDSSGSSRYVKGFDIGMNAFWMGMKLVLNAKVHYKDSYSLTDLHPVKGDNFGYLVFTTIIGNVSIEDVDCLIVDYVYDSSWEK